jgi:large subunit ribosomal protein L35
MSKSGRKRPLYFEKRSYAVPRKAKAGKMKLKTHKATSKRFRLTGSGMLVRTKGGKSHLRRRTSKRTTALFTEMIPVQGEKIIQRVKRLAPFLNEKA